MSQKSIILFDGVCNLCNGFVNFVIKRDVNDTFLFGSLQSAEARAILTQHKHSHEELSTVILIENNKLYSRSTAALKISRSLGGGWPLLYGLIVFPRFLRDFVYRIVAKNRYAWFGKKDACMIPTPELRSKFI